MAALLHCLNNIIGLLIVIAFGAWSCAQSLIHIGNELKCLHEDFAAIHRAHATRDTEALAGDGTSTPVG